MTGYIEIPPVTTCIRIFFSSENVIFTAGNVLLRFFPAQRSLLKVSVNIFAGQGFSFRNTPRKYFQTAKFIENARVGREEGRVFSPN